MMRGSSAESLARLTEALVGLVTPAAESTLARELFAAAGVLRDQVAVRRAATDPSAAPEARSGLLRAIFAPRLGEGATSLLAAAGGLRWAASSDLTAAIERLGVEAVVRSAEAAGEGDRLEAELFGLAEAIGDHGELREALAEPARSVADKQALLRRLLDGRAAAGTVALAEQAVAGSHRTVAGALAAYSEVAAEARGRVVAYVHVAHALADADRERLAAVLQRDYGRPVHLNVTVEPGLLGGIRVEIGDQVIDGTVASRLDDARRRLAG